MNRPGITRNLFSFEDFSSQFREDFGNFEPENLITFWVSRVLPVGTIRGMHYQLVVSVNDTSGKLLRPLVDVSVLPFVAHC